MNIVLRDIIQAVPMLVAVGAFVQQARSTNKAVERHEARIQEVERLAASTAGALARATMTLDRVEQRLERHEKDSPCAEHTTLLQVFREELALLRAEGRD